jgi:hypothetical protein
LTKKGCKEVFKDDRNFGRRWDVFQDEIQERGRQSLFDPFTYEEGEVSLLYDLKIYD